MPDEGSEGLVEINRGALKSVASEISRVPDVAEVVKESGEKDDFTRVEMRG